MKKRWCVTVAYHRWCPPTSVCWNIYYLHGRGFPSGLAIFDDTQGTTGGVPPGAPFCANQGAKCIQGTYEPRSAQPHDPSPANAVEQSLGNRILSNIWERKKRVGTRFCPRHAPKKDQVNTYSLSLSLFPLTKSILIIVAFLYIIR